MIGRTLSHYEILDEISRGGMGVVYRARDLNLGREVAFKVLPDDLVHDPVRRERLLQEARAASVLEHPHIAVIHEVGDADGVTFIAMELIRGEKLSDTIGRGPLRPARALDLAIETAEGLARAHEKNIVHRDLKPANIMVTDDGHVKIIDFGLAKLIEPVSGEAATASVHHPHTEEGVVVGTAAYMSPEQARGGRLDHRTDVFSLGLTLYEMVAGRPAFQGASRIDTLQAVLTQPVPALSAGGSPAEITAELHRIIAKCTAKDPDDRYQGVKDLVVDLRAARRRLESSSAETMVAPRASLAARDGRVRVLAAIAVVVAAVVAGWLWWSGRPSRPSARSGKPALAVLYFENNTGDASLDWMRTGLTDMMVTDLSQSKDFEVLGTDRLVQILQDMRRIDDKTISADVVQEIAERGAVDTVLVGSFVKAGDTIRIIARLQEAHGGRIVTSERVEGEGEASVFSLVDELTRRFKIKLAELGRPAPLLSRPGETPETGLDRGLAEITTSSIEAYRYYAEGIDFHLRGLSAQAAPLLEQAITIDPEFAMAYAKLAVVHNNLVSLVKSDEYAEQAIARIDRLTTRERFYIEGFYYTRRPETIQRGIDAYKQGLALHPEHQASRHNLGLTYAFLERYPESIEQYEELIRRGTSNPTTYGNLSENYVAMGNPARGREVLEAFLARYPDNASALQSLAATCIAEGRFDEALALYARAEALDPLSILSMLGRRVIALLRHQWADAAAINDVFGGMQSAFPRFLSAIGRAQLAAVHGRGAEMLALSAQAGAGPGMSPANRAVSRIRVAQTLLRNGAFGQALATAKLALADAEGRDQEFEALQVLAVAEALTGNAAASARALARLETRANLLPSGREVRRVHWARGEIALGRGDFATAVTELGTAWAAMAPFGPTVGPPSSHPDLLYVAALANMKAGRDAEAIRLFDRLQSGHDRHYALDAYARSFYLLGQIHERRGDAAAARAQYTRFVELWGEGDLERGWVADARGKIAR